ncbi:transcriptional adapter 2B-like isoform X1 [Schistocerca gregaria]|uniref:transcriptional adapter 2B-like n=1 Tax=Schistocerca cancellata TaxID=274614 RepID=UPI002119A558|nr:transcriptional adapter 2B-like [Schistocerca cancellata]XP_049828556.1 transcriptional adapter 2B-like isoform X1 [Schistocerca gregaria]
MADLFAKYNCTYCQEDITGLRIKCAECPDFDLCLQCFSAGGEIGQHRNDHAYQFMDSGAIGVGLGRGGWSAREELHLLNAIEQYGFGNWEDISRHIETRTSEEAKEEYISRFIEGSIGRLTWPPAQSSKSKLTDQTCTNSDPLSPTLTAQLPPMDITPEEATQLGYMPQRDDFEREYDNGAESLVSSLFVNNIEDEELDIALKLAQVDMYTRHLRERARRKRLVRDYQLVSQFFASNRKDRPVQRKKLSKEEREFQDRMRVFTQFHTAQEHEHFLHNLQRERELRLRISELMRYRRNGLTQHEECTHFEQQRLQFEEWKEKRSGSSGSILSSQSRKRERNDDGSSSIEERSTCRSSRSPSHDSSGDGVETMTPEEISTLPEYHLLTPHEVKLCTSLNMKPSQYLTWKTLLLREHGRKGAKKEDFLSSENSGPETQILHYLVNSGWITAR